MYSFDNLVISVYEDRTFDFVLKTPPAAELIKKFAKIKAGSGKGKNEIVGKLTREQLREIAEIKLPDLNAYTVEEAMKIVEGTARNMGIAIKGVNDQELAEQAAEAEAAAKELAKEQAKLEKLEAENAQDVAEQAEEDATEEAAEETAQEETKEEE